MKVITIYKYLTAFLILINISLITFFVFFNAKPKPLQKQIVQILNLNGDQHDLFSKSAQKHHLKIDSIQRVEKKIMKEYFHTLSDSNLLKNKDSISRTLHQIEIDKLEVTYTHLAEIKQLLKPHQIDGFKKFTDLILHNNFPPSKEHPRRREDSRHPNHHHPPPGRHDFD